MTEEELLEQNRRETESQDPEDRWNDYFEKKWQREKGGHKESPLEKMYKDIQRPTYSYDLDEKKKEYEKNKETLRTGKVSTTKDVSPRFSGITSYVTGSSGKHQFETEERTLTPEELERLRDYNEQLRAEIDFNVAVQNKLSAAAKEDGYSAITSYPGAVGGAPVRNRALDAVRQEFKQKQDSIAAKVTEQEHAQFLQKEDVLESLQEEYSTFTPQQQEQFIESFIGQVLRQNALFRKYWGTDYLYLTGAPLRDLALNYYANAQVYGEQGASETLNRELQDIIGHNQSGLEKLAWGLVGMGPSGASMALEGAGMLYGVARYLFYDGWHDLDNPEYQGVGGTWRHFLNSVFNNGLFQYGVDVEQYGTFLLGEQRRLKESGDIGYLNIVKTLEEEESIWNAAGMAEILKSEGFSAVTMLLSMGTSGIITGITRAATKRAVKQMASKGFRETTKRLARIHAREKFAQMTVPGMMGTIEGFQNGAQTYDQVMESGEQMLHEQLAAIAEEQVNSDRFQPILQEYIGEDGEKHTVTRYRDTTTDEVYDSYEDALQGMYGELINDPKYQEAMSKIHKSALSAAGNDIIINSAINGFLNSTVQLNLEASGVRKALREYSTLFKGTTRGTGQKILEGLAEVASETYDEGAQSVSSEVNIAAAEHNIATFINNKYNGDATLAVCDNIAGDWSAAWSAFNESITSKETIESGLMGGIGAAIGTPYGPRRNRQGTWGRGEGESRIHAFSRFIPWRSGLLGGFYNNDENAKDPEKVASDYFSEWLKDLSNKGKFDGIVGASAWAAQMDREAEKGNEFGYRNGAMGRLISTALALSTEEGSDQYNEVIAALQESMALEEGTEAAANAVERLRNLDKEGTKDMSDAELLERTRSNAKKMFDTIMEVRAASKQVDKLFGENVDLDLKQTLIYMDLQRKDWEHRKQQIEEDISGALSSMQNSKGASTLTREQKNLIARYGSLENAKKIRQSIQKQINTLEKQKVKKAPKETRETVAAIRKSTLANLKEQLKSFEVLDQIAEDADVTLNEQDIASLNEFERSLFVNGNYLDINGNVAHHVDENGEIVKEKAERAQAQQDVVDNFIRQGETYLNSQKEQGETEKEAQHHEEFGKKLIDLGVMTKRIKEFYKRYIETLNNPYSLKGYINDAKKQQRLALLKKQVDNIANMQEYTEFKKAIFNLDVDPETFDSILQSFVDQGNENAKRLVAHGQDIQAKQALLKAAKEYDDQNDQDLILRALEYLDDLGIDINDRDAVTQALSEADENGENKFKKYVEEREKHLAEKDKSVIYEPGQIISLVQKFNRDYNALKKEHERLSKPIEPEPTNPEDSAPPAQNDATPQEEKHEQKKETAPQNSESSEIINTAQQVSGQEISSCFAKILEMVGRTTATPEVKAQIIKLLQGLSAQVFQTKEDLLRALQRAATKAASSSSKGDPQLIHTVTTLVGAYRIGLKKQERKQEYNGYYNSQGISETSPQTASINIAYIRANYPESPLIAYYDRYNIEEAITNGILDGNPEIFFITDSSLTEEVKQNMTLLHEKEPWNEHHPPYREEIDIPIIAVVKSKSGPIEIKGERYQPVAIMPETSRLGSPGSVNMKIIREQVDFTSEEPFTLLQKDGKPVTTHKIKLAYNREQTLVNQGKPSPVRVTNERGLSSDEIAELSAKTEEEKRQSSTYKKARSRFLSRVERVKGVLHDKVRYGLQYVIHNSLNPLSRETITLKVRDLSRTTNADGKTLPKIFRSPSRTVDQIFNFNHRTQHIGKIIQNFIGSLYDVNGEFIGNQEAYDQFTKAIGRYLYVPTGYVYTVENNQILLKSKFTGNTIVLADIKAGMSTDDIRIASAKFFSNLIMDGAEVRRNGTKEFVYWQVDFGLFDRSASLTAQQKSIVKQQQEELYDDDILESDAFIFERGVDTILFETPGNENKPQQPPSPTPPTGEGGTTTTPSGTIDTTTGQHLESKPVKTSQNPVQDRIKDFLKSVKDLFGKVVKQGTSYVLGENTYAPLEEQGKKATKTQGLIDSVSSTINTIIEDFFNNKVSSKSEYEGVSSALVKSMAGSLYMLRITIEESGLTIIPGSVNVIGTTEEGNKVGSTISFMVHDNSGQISTVNVVYYNTKTFTQAQANAAAKNAAIQKQLLSQNNLNITNTYILPVHVGFNNQGNLSSIEIGDNLLQCKVTEQNKNMQEQEKESKHSPTVEVKKATPVRSTPIPVERQWDNLSKETKQALVANNPELTKEIWETYEDWEMENELKCCE